MPRAGLTVPAPQSGFVNRYHFAIDSFASRKCDAHTARHLSHQQRRPRATPAHPLTPDGIRGRLRFFSALAYALGPARAISLSQVTPTNLWPLAMNAIPPYIFFSARPLRRDRLSRIRRARPSSNAVPRSSRRPCVPPAMAMPYSKLRVEWPCHRRRTIPLSEHDHIVRPLGP